jgi:hypothetical protein
MMGGVRFRGVRVVSGEAEKLSKIATALSISLVILLFAGAPLIFLYAYTGSIYVMPFIALLIALMLASLISWSSLRRAASVELTNEGLILGRRLVSWDDIEDVRVWSESYREAEVESAPVIGYGMYGYAYGKTLPTTATYMKYDYIVLQVFHKGGVETIYIPKERYWPFVKTLSRILDQRGLAPKWLRDLEYVRFS